MANDEQKDPLNRLVDRFRGSSGDGGRKSDPSQRKVHFSIWYFIAALLVIMWFQTFVSEQQTNRISYSEFKQLIKSGKVDSVIIGADKVTATLKDGKEPNSSVSALRVEDPDLVRDLDAQGIKYSGAADNKWLGVSDFLAAAIGYICLFLEFSHAAHGGRPAGSALGW